MDHSEWLRASNGSLTLSTALYLLAFTTYFIWLFSRGQGKGMDFLAGAVFRIAWFLHLCSLLMRTAASGFVQPPWLSFYEALVYGAWCVASAHLIAEMRFKSRWTGLFATTVILAALGWSWLLPDRAIGQLDPFTKNPWFFAHVGFYGLALGAFLVSAFFSIFYLLCSGLVKETWLTGVCAILIVLLGVAAKADPGFGHGMVGDALLTAILLAYSFPAFFGWMNGAQVMRLEVNTDAGWLGEKTERLAPFWKTMRGFYFVGLLLQMGLTGIMLRAHWKVEGLTLESNPSRTVALGVALVLAWVGMGILWARARVVGKIPRPEKLDRWSYQMVLIGIPLLSVSMILGAIWSYFAIGNYWSWHVNETWAFVLWCYFTICVHVRTQADSASKKASFLSVMGSFAVLAIFLVLPSIRS